MTYTVAGTRTARGAARGAVESSRCLIVAPVLAGVMMHAYDLWRRSRAEHASRLATFWGGAAFAVGFSAAQFALLTF